VSSTILYLAIVAIWAGVLVPRWLRREPHRETTARQPSRRAPRQPSRQAGTHPGELVTDVPDAAGIGADDPGLEAGAGSPLSMDPAVNGLRSRRGQRLDGRGRDGQGREGLGRDGGSRDSRRAQRASGVVTARRRLFGLLVLLLAAAVVIAVAGLAAWWVVLPPAGMLAGYTMLLREAARADAERRVGVGVAGRAAGGAVAADAAAGTVAAGARAGSASAPAAEGVGEADEAAPARVIDLTPRVGDEFYDQYADAKLRAVGD
jgi:hypothetical protein